MKKSKRKIDPALLEGLGEPVLTFICFGIGAFIVSLFGVELDSPDIDSNLIVLLGVVVLLIIFVIVYALVQRFKKTTKGATHMKPIIGILAGVDDELITKVQDLYIDAIERSGGTPVLLPYVRGEETIKSFADLCDGFFFTGGADIDPRHYGEEAKSNCGPIQAYRDELEFNVFQKVINTSKPILAICRGAQLVNVALGGTLYQDIPSEINTNILHRQTEPKLSPSHSVQILEDTPLFDLVGKTAITANSFHHQAIKTLGDGLEIMAVAEDGIIEAVYSSKKQYIRAYQWHPERLFETDRHNRMIFEDFVNACK